MADDHSAVVQRRVFEEDIFDEPLVDVGVDEVARAYHLVEPHATFHHDERPHLLFAHAHAGHDDWDDFVAVRHVVLAFP